MEYIYSLDFAVRDYECDLQGIVNNANYQHYYEHTRHTFLQQQGGSFAAFHDKGVDLVVARIEMAFKAPLKAGDEFISELAIERVGIKYRFHQRIIRKGDNKLINTAIIDSVAIVNGKLCTQNILSDFIKD